MATNETIRAEDVLPVRSRISWGAIFAGAMVALSLYFLLTMLGAALGLSVGDRIAQIGQDIFTAVEHLIDVVDAAADRANHTHDKAILIFAGHQLAADRLNRQVFLADGGRNHRVQFLDIERGNEMHFDLPLAGGSLEGGANRGRGVERFGQQIGNAPGFTLGGGQAGNKGCGCGVARQAEDPLKETGYPDDIDRVSHALSRSFPGTRPQEHRQFLHSFSGFDL
jgi:hypothetical protein